VPDHLTVPATSRRRSGGAEQVERRAEEEVGLLAGHVDWEAALPARARTVSWRVQQAVKRTLDILLSAAGLALLSPLLAAVAVVVVLDSPGTVLYAWQVVGYRGRRFTGYKFRTMVTDADVRKARLLPLNEMTGPVFKMRHDPRVTRFGRFLRKYSLDELPELWSVLVGDMSLVGPRPLAPHEFVNCTDSQRQKLSVRPGVTCLWQVSGRSEIRDFNEWVRLDKDYIQRWNLLLDATILARTVVVVVRGAGAY